MKLKIGDNEYSLTKALAVAGALITFTAGAFTVPDTIWPRIGWTTPRQVDEQIAAMEEELGEKLNAIIGAIEGNHDAWKCDEYDEELEDLLQRQADGDDSVAVQERIDRIRELRNNRNCGRFDE